MSDKRYIKGELLNGRIFFYQWLFFHIDYSKYRMSIYRQSSPEEAQSSIYGSRLMVKDSQIQKLQNEVAELTQAKLDYQHSEDALDRLKKKVQDAEREKDKADWSNNEAVRTAEASLKGLKNQFDDLSLELKSKAGELNDLSVEKKSLENNILQKNTEIDRLKGKVEIEEREKTAVSEYEFLLQQQQLVKTQLKQLNQDLDDTSKNNKDVCKVLSSKEGTVIGLKLQIENKDRKLDHYEKENNALDAEIEEAIEKESALLKQICQHENTQKELGMEEIGLKSKVKKLENELQEINKQIRLYEKQRNRDAKANIKTRQNTLKRLIDAQESEHRQINILTKKNGQIAEINDRLKEDLKFCDDHLGNVKRCNELMMEFLEKCRNEDKNIIELIQKRMNGVSVVAEKSAGGVGNSAKMGYSRSTQHSAWMDV